MPDSTVLGDKIKLLFTFFAVISLVTLGTFAPQAKGSPKESTPGGTNSVAAKSAAESKARITEAQLMAKLDDMDFNIFTNKQWERIKESHAQDVWVESAR